MTHSTSTPEPQPRGGYPSPPTTRNDLRVGAHLNGHMTYATEVLPDLLNHLKETRT